MKKNIIISILALMLAAAAAGCGQSDSGSGSALVDGNTSTQTESSTAAPDSGSSNSGDSSAGETTPSSDSGEAVQTETSAEFGENADKKVDMDKIEGTETKTDKSGTKGDGEMTTCKIKIDEVKIAPVDDVYMVVIQFDFKNTSSSELNFSGEVYAEAYQDGMELQPAVVINEIEGYSPDTMMQRVEPGDSIKVQKAFTTSDPNAPVEVYVRDAYDNTGKKYLAQVFRVKE